MCTCNHLLRHPQPKLVQIDLKRPWPPVAACCFTHNLTCVTYQGSASSAQASTAAAGNGQDPVAASKPKGVVLYANFAIPSQVSGNWLVGPGCVMWSSLWALGALCGVLCGPWVCYVGFSVGPGCVKWGSLWALGVLCGVLYAQAPSFYWELELTHIGESSSDASHVAMGYSPSPQLPAEGQPWNYPKDSVFLRRLVSPPPNLVSATHPPPSALAGRVR